MIYQSLVGFCLIFQNIFSTYAWLTLSWLSRLITNDVYQIDFRVKKSKKACTKGYTMLLKPLNFGLLTPQCYWDFLGQKQESRLNTLKANFFSFVYKPIICSDFYYFTWILFVIPEVVFSNLLDFCSCQP